MRRVVKVAVNMLRQKGIVRMLEFVLGLQYSLDIIPEEVILNFCKRLFVYWVGYLCQKWCENEWNLQSEYQCIKKSLSIYPSPNQQLGGGGI